MSVTMKPIGTMKSLFQFKNGTPRQASVCHHAPGILTVEKSVFNNPEHSLEGLQEFSHAWVIFVFHKNNNMHTKAKVKPPRLNGKRTGVFSSRSPYRPNNIGLSLVKIDKIEGATIYFSGVDMIDGTPVLDVKPYIPEYDSPVPNMGEEGAEPHFSKPMKSSPPEGPQVDAFDDRTFNKHDCVAPTSTIGVTELEEGFFALSAALDKAGEVLTSQSSNTQDDVVKDQCKGDMEVNSSPGDLNSNGMVGACGGADDDLDIFLGGILSHAVDSLSSEIISHTNKDAHTGPEISETACANTQSDPVDHSFHIEGYKSYKSNAPDNQTFPDSDSRSTKADVANLSREPSEDKNSSSTKYPVVAPWLLNPPVQKLRVTFTAEALQQLQLFTKSSPDPNYRLQLLSNPEEAESAIRNVLHEEPRSVYRRQHCQDSLYFFTVDVVHITCWFDEDVVQVVRLKPIAAVSKLSGK